MHSRHEERLYPPSDLPPRLVDYCVAFSRHAALGYSASAIMHEIGNALTVVSGHTQLMSLKRENLEIKDVLDRLDKMLVQINRIHSAIHRFGSFGARSAGGKQSSSPVTALENALFAMSRRCSLAGVEIERDIEVCDRTVNCDPTLLEFIILEMIALGISEMGSGTMHIATKGDELHWELVIRFIPLVDADAFISSLDFSDMPFNLTATLFALEHIGGELYSVVEDHSAGWRLVLPFNDLV